LIRHTEASLAVASFREGTEALIRVVAVEIAHTLDAARGTTLAQEAARGAIPCRLFHTATGIRFASHGARTKIIPTTVRIARASEALSVFVDTGGEIAARVGPRIVDTASLGDIALARRAVAPIGR
jgi:hypothetical protein